MFNAKEAVSRRVLQQILVLPILVVWVKVENKVLKTQSKYSPYCRILNSNLNIQKKTEEEENWRKKLNTSRKKPKVLANFVTKRTNGLRN